MLYLLAIVSVLFLTYRYKYLDNLVTWVSTKKNQAIFAYKLLSQLHSEQANKTPPPESFSIHPTDASASISYDRLNKQYQITVPFNRVRAATMSSLTVELIYSNGTRLNITQQPGVPYSYTAQELGGAFIDVCNADNEKQHSYVGTRPLFCDEVMDDEE